MLFSEKKLFILLWALSPILNLLAFKCSQYPNQLCLGYKLLLVFLAALVFRDFVKIVTVQMKWLVLVSLYVGIFIVVSYFGVDFATSIKYHILYLPLILLDFFIAFTIGYKYHEHHTFNYIVGVAIILIGYALADVYLTPNKIRLVSHLDLPMAIPVSVFIGNAFLAIILVVFLLASMQKTTAVIGLFSFGLAILFKKFLRLRSSVFVLPRKKVQAGCFYNRKLLLNLPLAFVVLVIISPQYIPRTIERFSSINLDTKRAAISNYSFELLQEHFPKGIGLGGFSFLSADYIPYTVFDARGNIRFGANLHNSFMTWALEGGIAVLIIMAIIFWNLLRIIRQFFLFDETKVLGVILFIWFLSGMLFGLFHAWHNTGAFWLLFGYSFGCNTRYRSKIKANASKI